MTKHSVNPLLASAGLLAAVVAAALVLGGCEKGGQQAPAMARPPARVTAAAAVTRDVPVYLEEIGRTVPVEMVSIVPQVGGKVVAAHVNDGDYVKKGQLLFEIDPRPFDAALASANASVAQNKAELELAKTEFKRVQGLMADQAVSPLEFDQKKSALAVAEAKIAASQADVEKAKLNLEYAKIFSPIDGRAGARLVDAGNVVKENDASMLMVQRLDPIYAEFTVTENDLGTVRKYVASKGLELGDATERGLAVEVDVPGDSAKVLAALGVPATQPAQSAAPSTTQPARNHAGPREGKLTFLDNTVQKGTGTVRLRATLPNADRYFWPGQFVNVRMVLTTKKDAVMIPAVAQQVGQQGPYVYVVRPDSTAEIRPITPGQRQGDLIVVEQGLSPGERVVVTGQMAIMPNAKVDVTNPAPPAGATARAGE